MLCLENKFPIYIQYTGRDMLQERKLEPDMRDLYRAYSYKRALRTTFDITFF